MNEHSFFCKQQMDMMTSDILKDLRQKRSFFSHLWSGIKNVAHHVVDGVKTAFHAVENGVKTAVTKVVSVAKKVGTAIWNEGYVLQSINGEHMARCFF